MIYLHKILPVVFSPIFLGLFVILLGTFWQSRRIIITACAFLYVASTPIFAENFFKSIEYQSAKQDINSVPKADVIVVLSGMLNDVAAVNGTAVEWGESADRFVGGIELFRAGKAPKIVFTGGQMPWSFSTHTEGQELKKFAIQLGVPSNIIGLTNVVSTTAEEAAEVKKLFGSASHNVILVTSAFHMQRAKRLFEKHGIDVIPYCVDFRTTQKAVTPMDFLPDAHSLKLVETASRELLGRMYYAIKL